MVSCANSTKCTYLHGVYVTCVHTYMYMYSKKLVMIIHCVIIWPKKYSMYTCRLISLHVMYISFLMTPVHPLINPLLHYLRMVKLEWLVEPHMVTPPLALTLMTTHLPKSNMSPAVNSALQQPLVQAALRAMWLRRPMPHRTCLNLSQCLSAH